MTQIITKFSDISSRYDAAFVDLWGCMHNGVEPLADAVKAMCDFRAQGGKVVLVTNAPRDRISVEEHLLQMGMDANSWDIIASSGDAARAAMFRGMVGEKVWFVGEEHDQNFFNPLHIVENPIPIQKVSLQEAEGIVCCGPFDPQADPELMRGDFLYAKQKGLKLLCANPDLVVDRGDVREWCAGTLAALYTEMGGESLYFGKPHPPIYDLARQRLASIDSSVTDTRIICIGDGIRTDIQGGIGEDLDTLFITGGLAAKDTKTKDQPDPAALTTFLQGESLSPTYAIGMLR